MAASPKPLAQLLARHTRPGELVETLANGRVRCLACGHRCLVPPGREGICRVRFNENGVLKVPFGYVAALQVDPVEKKPFFHALPGAKALSFGMLGCDLHCGYCQNWLTSQTLRDPSAAAPAEEISPEDLVRIAGERGARIVTSTYNEPLITSEWAAAVFRVARREGLRFVYAGNLPGFVRNLENTYCPSCHTLLVERLGFRVLQNRLAAGLCPSCQAAIPGVWS